MEEQSLFPVFDMPDFADEAETEEQKYRTSVYWDMEKGDFVRDGSYRLVPGSGRDTYIQWCYKMVYTQRYEHLAYPEYIGTELSAAMKEQTDEAVESALERTISEALLVNDQTEYVRDFAFTWQGDQLWCEFTVKGNDWEEFTLKAAIQTSMITGGGETV